MPTLQDPLQVGAWKLPNRVVLAPLTRCRASIGRVPNALMAQYYRQRAGAGLIISEATSISGMGVGYPDTPGIWSDEQVAGWKLVTQAVHEAGGRMVLQLWHVGRISDPLYLDGRTPPSRSGAPIASACTSRRVAIPMTWAIPIRPQRSVTSRGKWANEGSPSSAPGNR
jgi:2,4-dienoyl-CoA reductase-like NADH-dependent reductase (Old Yellow Enzyme family)